jgi:hypothetical protein
LFDFGYEKDKITLIRAALLLGYWFVEPNDIDEGWYWVGIASSISQSIGLHRRSRADNLPTAQHRAMKRLWWCCVYRDRWVAFGNGRQTRLFLEQSDIEKLTLSDLIDTKDTDKLSSNGKQIIETCNSCYQIFLEALDLSIILGSIITSCYNPKPVETSRFQQLENKLKHWHDSLSSGAKADLSGSAHNELLSAALFKQELHIAYQ